MSTRNCTNLLTYKIMQTFHQAKTQSYKQIKSSSNVVLQIHQSFASYITTPKLILQNTFVFKFIQDKTNYYSHRVHVFLDRVRLDPLHSSQNGLQDQIRHCKSLNFTFKGYVYWFFYGINKQFGSIFLRHIENLILIMSSIMLKKHYYKIDLS